MKDGDSLPLSTSSFSAAAKKETGGYSALFSKGRYKFWALAAILLLAFWSMLTGTVNHCWSVGNINHFADDLVFPIHEDLDVLDGRRPFELVYHGQFDDSRPSNNIPVTGRDLSLVIDLALSCQPIPSNQKPRYVLKSNLKGEEMAKAKNFKSLAAKRT